MKSDKTTYKMKRSRFWVMVIVQFLGAILFKYLFLAWTGRDINLQTTLAPFIVTYTMFYHRHVHRHRSV